MRVLLHSAGESGDDRHSIFRRSTPRRQSERVKLFRFVLNRPNLPPLSLCRKENLVLDYPLQQEKLVPALATTYAFFLSYVKLEDFRALSLNPDAIRFELLPEVSEKEFFIATTIRFSCTRFLPV